MVKRNDLILIGVVIVICLSVFLIMNATKKEGSKLIITVDGKLYDTLDLNKDTIYTVKLENGAYNTFRIKDGTVDMIKASCPDKLCVSQRNISCNQETIVCLPNKVVLEVAGGKESGIDTIAR